MTYRVSFFCLVLALCGCKNFGGGVPGSGVSKTETRHIDSFDKVEFQGSGRLEIEIGNPSPLIIAGDDNLLPLVESSVERGRLTIRPKERISPKTGMVFKMATADVKSLVSSGSAEVIVSGIGNKALSIQLDGAGSLRLVGTTGRFDLSISGAVQADAADLIAQVVTAELNGAGSADVHATEKLKATISGTGTIRYRGNPKVEKSVSGVGSISKMN